MCLLFGTSFSEKGRSVHFWGNPVRTSKLQQKHVGVFWGSSLAHPSPKERCAFMKKREKIRVFCVRYRLGLPAPNSDQRTFREKSFGVSKAFTQIKWCFQWEVLWRTFLSRKVREAFGFRGFPCVAHALYQRQSFVISSQSIVECAYARGR